MELNTLHVPFTSRREDMHKELCCKHIHTLLHVALHGVASN
jgi:hypothetical protein